MGTLSLDLDDRVSSRYVGVVTYPLSDSGALRLGTNVCGPRDKAHILDIHIHFVDQILYYCPRAQFQSSRVMRDEPITRKL